MIRSSLLAALLLTVSAFANTPEYLIGGTVPTAAARERHSPSIASDGENFFAVWADMRAGESSVIGARIARDGRILDPLGLRIGTARNWVNPPSVTWDGSAYLVVWTASELEYANRRIRAARVAPDGSIVMEPRPISEYGWIDNVHSVASNGTVSVIVYTGGPSSGWIAAAVLDRDGNTLHHEELSSSGTAARPVIAAGTSRFVVTWTQWSPNGGGPGAVRAVAVDAAGHVASAPTTLANGVYPSIGTDGSRFTVTWLDDGPGNGFLASRTFDENLAPVNDGHILLNGRPSYPSVLWLGDRYEVLTMRDAAPGRFRMLSVALDRDGTPQTPRNRGEIAGERLLQEFVAGTNGVDVLAVRAVTGLPDNRTSTIFSQLYPGNADGSDTPVLMSWSGNAHRDPSIASSPSGHFAAWVEQDGVFATRIDRGGNSLDGRGIRLSDDHRGFAQAAFDGTNYVVAWRDDFHLTVRWIAPLTGATVAEAQWIPLGVPELALAVSPDATFVAYTDAHIVRVTRIPHDTHVPDPVPLDVSPEDMMATHPVAAWNRSELLVAWSELRSDPRTSPPSYYPIRVHAARVTAGLSLLDATPLLVVAGADEYTRIGLPSVASNGTDWLVVTDSEDGDVLARRVLRSGMVEGNQAMKLGVGAEPVVAWTGSRYAVAWKEGDIRDPRSLLLAAVPRSGALVASTPALVSTGAAESRPSIVSGGGGEAVVAYTKFSHLPEHAGAERSFFRIMDSSPRGRVVRR